MCAGGMHLVDVITSQFDAECLPGVARRALVPAVDGPVLAPTERVEGPDVHQLISCSRHCDEQNPRFLGGVLVATPVRRDENGHILELEAFGTMDRRDDDARLRTCFE